MKSERTKQCGRLQFLFGFLHFFAIFGPFLYFIPYAFIIGTPVEKIGLSFTIIVCLCLTIFMFIAEARTRMGFTKTIMWVLIVGVLFCLTEVKTFIYVMAIVSVIDELLIVKLRNKYKDAKAANREIDKRG